MSARLFSKPALGIASLVMASIAMVLFGYALVVIVPPLTMPPGFIEERIKSDKSMKIEYVATLEYESYAIRTKSIQVAMGFLVGILFSIFGLILFTIGATDAFEGSGSSEKMQIAIKSTAPGLIVLAIGGGIISLAITRDLGKTFEASYNERADPKIKTQSISPPIATKGSTEIQKD